ncbi:response regulator transcription factor [Flaviaesturariibacter amylovorans]|uniref:Response regulator transcription factor n=1 Tax=Flaviaesturariibacter amylovorans TaxID=1084520 RepID=A0ABP8GF96_9BACT
MATVLIADDHPLTLLGSRAYVEGLGHKVVEVCSNGITAYNAIRLHCPDVALLDMRMPGMNAIEILERLGRERSQTRVIILTMHNESSIFNRARELGVRGYLLKEFAVKELETCLGEVVRNSTWFSPKLQETLRIDSDPTPGGKLEGLTPSERKILSLIAKQQSSKAIADLLFISERTVENHRSNIIRKLSLPPEKNALLLWAVQNLPEA